jgi:HK97 family phage portal protein
MARESIGLALAAEQFSAAFFGNGSQPGGVLTPSTPLSPLAGENLRKAMDARHQGARNAHKWLLAEPGMTFTPATINPRNSQLNELRVHQLREIARYFKIPVSMIGDLERSTYSNVEQENPEVLHELSTPLAREDRTGTREADCPI